MKKLAPAAFYSSLTAAGVDSFYGVPDSLLKDFCAYVTDTAPAANHTITANEGSAVGMAMGYHFATGKIGAVYLQNSGFGNIVNPQLSLAHKQVYNVPIMYIVGWRGQPGVKDEPQHVAQGRLMEPCLQAAEIPYTVLPSADDEVGELIRNLVETMKKTNEPHCLLVRKETFEKYKLKNARAAPESVVLSREQAISIVAECAGNAVCVSTTGMPSRELFEYRARNNQGHSRDFLTVGGMGHCSQIAAGIAMARPSCPVVCLDGDGAAIMHMGGFSTVGDKAKSGFLKNFKHVIVNNGAHDSVGGQPTAAFNVDLSGVAAACGYRTLSVAKTEDDIRAGMSQLMSMEGPVLLEIHVKTGNRADLGRPTTTPVQNKQALMEYIAQF